MKRNSPRKIPIRWVVTAILLLPPLALVGTYVWVHNANNAAAQQLEDRLRDLPLPPRTTLVDSGWAAQRLAGAGNGMQYAGALLVRSHLDLADLEEFYSKERGDQHVISTADEGLSRKSLIFETNHDLHQPDLFMVVSSDEPPGGSILHIDIRGH